MRILITGAAGGIGSVLAHALHTLGHELVLIDNLRNGYAENLKVDGKTFGTFIQADIRDILTLDHVGSFDAVIHLAAITALPDCESHKEETISINVGGTVSVLEYCRVRKIPHVIFASTSAVYENNSEEVFTEDLKTNPRLLYSLSKRMAEDICESYRQNYGMTITTLRFFNVFGPNQDIHRKNPPLLNYLASSIRKGEVPFLHSTGNQARDYVHIDDVVKMIQLCLDKTPNETFNVCTNTLLTVRQIASCVLDGLSSKIEPVYREAIMMWASYPELFTGSYPLKKEVVEKEVNKYSRGSFARAERLIGWKPNTDLETLMKATAIQIYERMGKQ
jgi:nucleoside-diphosphate-sugar epimerase